MDKVEDDLLEVPRFLRNKENLAEEEMLQVINTAIGTSIAIMNMTDDKNVEEMAAHIADSLISLTEVPDL